MSLAKLLNTAIEASSEDAEELVGRMAEASGVPGEEVRAILGGGECRDLDLVQSLGRTLELDAVDVLQVALDGTLMESRLSYGDTDTAGATLDCTGQQVRLAKVLGGELAANQNDFISSTEAEARDGDIIDQSTWRLGHYRKNPVVLDGHDVQRVIGRTSKLQVQGGALLSRITWNVANALGAERAQEHQAGFRSAVSVRWITGKATSREKLDKTDPRFQAKPKRISTRFGTYDRFGLLLQNNTLLEQSSVSVPGDPRALQQRGIGPDAVQGVADGAVNDPVAAATFRSGLLELLGNNDVWSDDGFRRELASAMRFAVRNDTDLRRTLCAAILSTQNLDHLSEDERMIARLGT